MESLGLLGLLWLLLSGGGGGSTAPSSPRKRWPKTPALPPAGTQTSLPPAPAPWPQVTPAGLPPFPGSGWQYDEPPPLEVQQRAAQLVNALWAQGSGAFKIEQTAGRWIAYRAEMVKAVPANKKGVVAYRLKPTAALPKAPSAPAPRATAPAPAPAERQGSTVLVTPQAPVPPAWSVHTGPATVFSTPAPSAPPSELALPVLRRGIGMPPAKPNADVRVLQQKLRISDDGEFGGDTQKAVMAFQAAHGLAADGVVGPKTWAALFASGQS